MKILVLGASGMAGHIIYTYFAEQGNDVYGVTRRNNDLIENNIICDVTDVTTLKEIIDEGNYDAVINCVGILNKNADDNISNAILVNGYLPHYLATITEDKKTKVIQMSTDCVFSGKVGNYSESSIPDGETVYDRTKALGELNDAKNLTFRNSIVGPDINKGGIGLFHWFMNQKKGPILGYLGAIWTGVTTLTLAKAMESALIQDLSGVYNLVNNEVISKYELLNLFNHYFKGDKVEIIPTETAIINKSLINTRKDFDFVVPSYEDMVREMRDWVVQHPHLYNYEVEGLE